MSACVCACVGRIAAIPLSPISNIITRKEYGIPCIPGTNLILKLGLRINERLSVNARFFFSRMTLYCEVGTRLHTWYHSAMFVT